MIQCSCPTTPEHDYESSTCPLNDYSLPELWQSLGFTPFMAEALADLEIPYHTVMEMSIVELTDKVLCWHGIIGFTSTIIDTLHTAKRLLGHNGETKL